MPRDADYRSTIGSTPYDLPPAELMPPIHAPLLAGDLTALQRAVLLVCGGAGVLVALYMLIFLVQSHHEWIRAAVSRAKASASKVAFETGDTARSVLMR